MTYVQSRANLYKTCGAYLYAATCFYKFMRREPRQEQMESRKAANLRMAEGSEHTGKEPRQEQMESQEGIL